MLALALGLVHFSHSISSCFFFLSFTDGPKFPVATRPVTVTVFTLHEFADRPFASPPFRNCASPTVPTLSVSDPGGVRSFSCLYFGTWTTSQSVEVAETSSPAVDFWITIV
ncbi:hypothetical protein BDV18DRAFT_68966 [Aspergillus unguis]